MNLNNWLLWFVIGIAAGWLIEFLVDYYFFGRRNRELESRLTEARAETDKLYWSRDEVNTELARETAAHKTLQTTVDALEATVATSAGDLRLLAARRGLVGTLGNALLRGDREGAARAVDSIEEALAARQPLEQTVRTLQNTNSMLNDELERSQVALRYQADDFGAKDARARHQLGLLVAAGGLLGALGKAIKDGDETAIRREIANVNAGLARAPQMIEVEVLDTRAVEALNAQVTEATAKQKALQMEVDDLTARTIATVSRIGLVTTAGGVLGDLGSALANGDESAVMAIVEDITARMTRGSTPMPTQTSQTSEQESAL